MSNSLTGLDINMTAAAMKAKAEAHRDEVRERLPSLVREEVSSAFRQISALAARGITRGDVIIKLGPAADVIHDEVMAHVRTVLADHGYRAEIPGAFFINGVNVNKGKLLVSWE